MALLLFEENEERRRRRMLKHKSKSILFLLMIALLLFSSLNVFGTGTLTTSKNLTEYGDHGDQREWIVKWGEGYEAPTSELFDILEVDHERRLLLIRLKTSTHIDQWLSTWSLKKEIEYIEPNLPMKISAIPNDPAFSSQSYLKQLNAEKAWEVEKENTAIKIAILDTGIDLNHSDLKPQIVQGANLLDSKKSVQDDNGHGTQIAGVLAAKGNNKTGISGVLWSAKIMPIKVLDKEGEGKPFTVSKGIYHAVDHGASIVLLSLGDRIYTKTMEEAVEYAEEKNVLVVAATGNEGSSVNYPAAFPTVLAVGAVNSQRNPASYSNRGPEVSVVGMGDVYTTQLNNKYGKASGTSMAAPQVAGLAALLMKKYPQLSVSEIRNHILYTAREAHSTGWDPETGHGLIDMNKALREPPSYDIYEPNNLLSKASVFPIDTMVRAELRNKMDEDWYQIDLPYKGKIQLKVVIDIVKTNGMTVSFYPLGKEDKVSQYNVKKERNIEVSLPKGRSYIKLKYDPAERRTTPLGYTLVNQFVIYEDDQFPNGSKSKATKIEGTKQKIVGTFHQESEYDWFYYDVSEKGELNLKVQVDTERLDPVVYIEQPNGKGLKIDEGNVNNGQEEQWTSIVEPGRYYFRIHHYYGHKVKGEYYLSLNFNAYFDDVNEPNNTLDTATKVKIGSTSQGTIHSNVDIDWYRVDMTNDDYLQLNLYDLPANVGIQATLIGADKKQIASSRQNGKEKKISFGDKLKPGIYYIGVKAEKPFPFDSYKIQFKEYKLIEGYRDIENHWAEKAIVKATKEGLVAGVGDYRFDPNGKMTRASTAVILQRMYQYPKPTQPDKYKDVSTTHWAYQSIMNISGAKVMRGFKDGRFGIDHNITRAEVAVILDRILNLETRLESETSFKDVSQNHWAYQSIMRLTEAGLLQGDKKGTFRPSDPISRAEFVTLISRIKEL